MRTSGLFSSRGIPIIPRDLLSHGTQNILWDPHYPAGFHILRRNPFISQEFTYCSKSPKFQEPLSSTKSQLSPNLHFRTPCNSHKLGWSGESWRIGYPSWITLSHETLFIPQYPLSHWIPLKSQLYHCGSIFRKIEKFCWNLLSGNLPNVIYVHDNTSADTHHPSVVSNRSFVHFCTFCIFL